MAKIVKISSRKKVYVTSKGLSNIKFELEFLKKEKRTEVAQRLKTAREFGDLAENSEYDAALDDQILIERRISRLEEMLKEAQVITKAPKTDFVVIGSTITIEMDGEVDKFTIVGRVEADPSKKRISNESPVGAALLGAKVGEIVEVATPIVRYKCKVLEIK